MRGALRADPFNCPPAVMAGLVPAIHAFEAVRIANHEDTKSTKIAVRFGTFVFPRGHLACLRGGFFTRKTWMLGTGHVTTAT